MGDQCAALRRFRLRAGLTQEALAERSGVSVRTIRGLETGNRRNPQRSSLRQLADALELSDGDRAELMSAEQASAKVVPRQLPPPPRRFTGRHRELAELTGAVRAADGDAVAVSAVGGAGGIGKTWLALHWAHRHADDFPDGQLYANLRGFDVSSSPVRPEVVLRAFLEALGVPSASLPLEAGALHGLFRSLTEGRRLLVVLDNARDTEQVVPLLPGRSASAVLVTSRNRLTGLVATHGATAVELDVLNRDDARQLLVGHVGRDRTDGEPGSVAELLDHCSGLPLALGIVAARVTGHPGFPLHALAEELRNTAARLDGFDAGEFTANLRAVFSASYGALDAGAARLFGLLGLLPSPDVGVPVVASLAARPVPAARRLLRALEHAHLVHQPQPGRYRMHDLTALYAAEQARAVLPADDRAAALERLVDHYVHTTIAADRMLRDRPAVLGLGAPGPGCVPEVPRDIGAAMTWLATEHDILLEIQALAAAKGWHARVWRLAQGLGIFHWRRGMFEENLVSSQRALAAAEALNEPEAIAITARNLGYDHLKLGHHAQAAGYLEQARLINEEHGFTEALAHTYGVLTHLAERGNDHRTAVGYALKSARLFRSLGKPDDEANALNAMGWHQVMLGEFDSAKELCTRALGMLGEGKGRGKEVCAVLHSLGYIAKKTGQYAEALWHLRRSIPLYEEIGDEFAEANAWEDIAEVHAAMSNTREAEHAWRTALTMFESQNRVADARRVSGRLSPLVHSIV